MSMPLCDFHGVSVPLDYFRQLCRDTREVERIRGAQLVASLQTEVSELRRSPPRRAIESQTITTVTELQQLERSKATAERELEIAGLDAEQAALDAQVRTQREEGLCHA